MNRKVQYTVEFSLQDGRQKEFKKIAAEMIALVEATERGALNYQLFFNEEETKCYSMEQYLDSKSMMFHLSNISSLLGEALKFSAITRIEIFGALSAEAHAVAASFGAVFYTSFDGFTR